MYFMDDLSLWPMVWKDQALPFANRLDQNQLKEVILDPGPAATALDAPVLWEVDRLCST